MGLHCNSENEVISCGGRPSNECHVTVWKIDQRSITPQSQYSANRDMAYCIDVHADNERIAIGTAGGCIFSIIRRGEKLKEEQIFAPAGPPVNAVQFVKGSDYLGAAIDHDNKITLWKVSRRRSK